MAHLGSVKLIHAFKVQLFWEGHKNLRKLPYGFDIYLVSSQTIRQIAQIFVVFSEKLNFTYLLQIEDHVFAQLASGIMDHYLR